MDQLVCGLCKRRYNLDTRQPYVVRCCFNTACRQCVEGSTDSLNLSLVSARYSLRAGKEEGIEEEKL